MKTILVLLTIYYSESYAKLSLYGNDRFPLDPELYGRILDHEECQRQLQHIRENPVLRVQFSDAGMRLPRGMLLGNLQDLGNFHQCLDIHETVEYGNVEQEAVGSDENYDEMEHERAYNMSIEGKFCMIDVPLGFNIEVEDSHEMLQHTFDPRVVSLPSQIHKRLTDHQSNMKKIKARYVDTNRSGPEESTPMIHLHLAQCVPKVCTIEETIEGLLFDLRIIGIRYYPSYCRIRNDKPWAPVDSVAVVIFSILGLLVLLSTSYEVYHNIICKKDLKEANEILISFSALTNSRRIVAINPNPKNIECLDGVRALATFWIVVGHVFFIVAPFISNPFNAEDWADSYKSIWISSATLSVDTFFLLSGLLLVYVTAEKLTGGELIRKLPIFYLNRLLRIFPVLAAVVLYEASFINRLGDGPIWDQVMAHNVHKCRAFWWTTLLHVQNFLNTHEICIGPTWYLAIDVQLHILSPLVLFWVFGRSRTSAWIALITALFASFTASTAFIFAGRHLIEKDYFLYYYHNILTRAPPFLLGLVFGYILHMYRRNKMKMNMLLSIFITAFFLCLLIVMMFCSYYEAIQYFDEDINYLLLSIVRPLWALSVGWIIFACVNGYGGPINWFLSLNVWKVPSRISYSMYLTHMSIIAVGHGTSLQPRYFTVGSIMFDFFAYLWISMFVAFLLTAVIDAPFAILFKKLLSYLSKKMPSGKKIVTKPNMLNENNQNASEQSISDLKNQ